MSNRFSMVTRCFQTLGLGIAIAAGLPGCLAHAQGEVVYEYPSDYVATVPARIEYYPSTSYYGHPVYLVEGRWYYRSHDRWVVYREEPVQLREYRLRQAPVYVGGAHPGYASPPGYRVRELEARREAERHEAERRAVENRRFEERRAAERRAEESRRFEEHRQAERRAEEARRSEARRNEERREAGRREAGRREAERHEAERRAQENRRNEENRRVAAARAQEARRRERPRHDDHDHDHDRDHDRRNRND